MPITPPGPKTAGHEFLACTSTSRSKSKPGSPSFVHNSPRWAGSFTAAITLSIAARSWASSVATFRFRRSFHCLQQELLGPRGLEDSLNPSSAPAPAYRSGGAHKHYPVYFPKCTRLADIEFAQPYLGAPINDASSGKTLRWRRIIELFESTQCGVALREAASILFAPGLIGSRHSKGSGGRFHA